MRLKVIPLLAGVLLTGAAAADIDHFISYSLAKPIELRGRIYDQTSFDAAFGIGYTTVSGALWSEQRHSLPYAGSCSTSPGSSFFFCSINIGSYSGYLTIQATDLSANLTVHDPSGAVIDSSALNFQSVQ